APAFAFGEGEPRDQLRRSLLQGVQGQQLLQGDPGPRLQGLEQDGPQAVFVYVHLLKQGIRRDVFVAFLDRFVGDGRLGGRAKEGAVHGQFDGGGGCADGHDRVRGRRFAQGQDRKSTRL